MVSNGEKWHSLLSFRGKKKKGNCEEMWQRGKRKENGEEKWGKGM